ncbi:MAG: sigma factor-like helix-turn-helix DNA-binding protein [Acidobacteriota bacterium]
MTRWCASRRWGRHWRRCSGICLPQERACLVLKEVMEFSLQEIAEIVGSSVGAVKAAIHRGRGKLKAGTVKSSTAVPRPRRASTPEHRQLLAAYAQCFNSRSWDDLVRLLAADARLEVLEVYDGLGSVSFTDRYCFNYSRFDFEWRFRLDEVEGETLLVVERFFDDRPEVFSVVRLWGRGGEVTRVRDYLHVPPYLLEALGIEPTQPLAPVGAR